MARRFRLNQSQRVKWAGTLNIAEPLTLIGWQRRLGVPVSGMVMIALDTEAGSSRWQLGTNSTDQVSGVAANTVGTSANPLAGTTLLYVWHCIACVFTSSTSRTSYLDGVPGATDTTAITVSGVDSVRMGARVASSVEAIYSDADYAGVCVYNVALTTAEIMAYSLGHIPRPQNIVFRPDLRGGELGVRDLIVPSRYLTAATALKTPSIASDAPLVHGLARSAKIFDFAVAATVAGGTYIPSVVRRRARR